MGSTRTAPDPPEASAANPASIQPARVVRRAAGTVTSSGFQRLTAHTSADDSRCIRYRIVQEFEMPYVSYPVRRITNPPAAVADFPADYWDCFAIATTGGTAGRWARLSLRGAESAGGIFSRLVWEGVLGFNLDTPGTPGTVAGVG